MKKLTILSIIFLITGILSFSQLGEKPKEDKSKKKSEKKIGANNEKEIDLVCKMKVAKNSKISALHNHKEYKFCGESCKELFMKNPDNYLFK